MQPARLAELLAPFLPAPLAQDQLEQLSLYLEFLVRWNARMNLTAVRKPEEIVGRHFGESLFLAAHAISDRMHSVVDVGSGAGFPGLPLKIFAPRLSVLLVESTYRKATFLREVVRALALQDIEVLPARAEELAEERSALADLVTMRAVERFDRALLVAAALVRPLTGSLGLLVGSAQVRRAEKILPNFIWSQPLPVPQSAGRVVLTGSPGFPEAQASGRYQAN